MALEIRKSKSNEDGDESFKESIELIREYLKSSKSDRIHILRSGFLATNYSRPKRVIPNDANFAASDFSEDYDLAVIYNFD